MIVLIWFYLKKMIRNGNNGNRYLGHVFFIVFESKKQVEQEKQGKYAWFLVCFFFLKNIKNIKTLRVFKEHFFDVLCVFKNCYQ